LRGPDQAERDGRSPPAPARAGELLKDVSNALVRIHKKVYGKGPTKVSSHLVRDDLLVCILEGGTLPSEHTLIAGGHTDTAVATRHHVRAVAGDDFVAAVEGVIGRRVVSFMATNDPHADLELNVFVLGDEATDGHLAGLQEQAARRRSESEARKDDAHAVAAELRQTRKRTERLLGEARKATDRTRELRTQLENEDDGGPPAG
jgi:uncharacterized protein YbcI